MLTVKSQTSENDDDKCLKQRDKQQRLVMTNVNSRADNRDW